MIDIQYNGAATKVAPDATVAGLVATMTGRALDETGAPADGRPLGLAVAVNAAVVPRREWAARVLSSGDQVEVLTAAQGG